MVREDPRTFRYGVLITVLITGGLLWPVALADWWTSRTDATGFTLVEENLTGIGGGAFLWFAGAALLAYAVAAFPVRFRRAATVAGLVASAGTLIVWTVLLLRMLRREEQTHQGWAARVWERRSDVSGRMLAETGADGFTSAIMVLFLLALIGCLLAFGRRHERTVLIVATMVCAVAGVLTARVRQWVTSGPETAEVVGSWPDGWFTGRVTVVVLAVLVLMFAVSLRLRPGQRGAAAWGMVVAACSLAAFYLIMFDTVEKPPLYPYSADETTALPTNPGVNVAGLLLLAMYLPLPVAIRVACIDRFRRPPEPPRPEPVPDDVVAGDVVADDVVAKNVVADDVVPDDVLPDDVVPVDNDTPMGRPV
ncbi:hypothetical protein [Actinoplanes flavus]|uniref:Uncharacterized protein n=1 Tax=Actinoplanes flavus TaxID=2820290 RepID=A0ABS3UX97_9ACTN|nr:hypothetical protein [Actinoplanes flavus]MBO3743205.1 hypothetical protein [Actinoplanes flavus]